MLDVIAKIVNNNCDHTRWTTGFINFHIVAAIVMLLASWDRLLESKICMLKVVQLKDCNFL
jgi:hypothetical protein